MTRAPWWSRGESRRLGGGQGVGIQCRDLVGGCLCPAVRTHLPVEWGNRFMWLVWLQRLQKSSTLALWLHVGRASPQTWCCDLLRVSQRAGAAPPVLQLAKLKPKWIKLPCSVSSKAGTQISSALPPFSKNRSC